MGLITNPISFVKSVTYHKQKVHNGSAGTVSGMSCHSEESPDVISQISVISSVSSQEILHHQPSPIKSVSKNSCSAGQVKPIKLGHHIFSSGEWKHAKFVNHPTMEMSLSIQTEAYKQFSKKPPVPNTISITAKLDSCAQSCLWSLRGFLRAGFNESDLIPVTLSLSAANHSRIEISGAVFVKLTRTSANGKEVSCSTTVYVSPAANGFFLSLGAMVDLGIVNRQSPLFPYEIKPKNDSADTLLSMQDSTLDKGDVQTVAESCSCPQRGCVQDRPVSLPFAAIPENNTKMKAWLLDMFSSSTFNTCSHQLLPAMEGPPIKIHMDEDAKPRAFHTPATIPLHWQEQVHSDLLRDEALGVIEKVPYGDQ